MYKKTLVAALTVLLCGAVFAEGFDGKNFYGKLSVGKERRTDSWTTSYDGGGSTSADVTTELTLLTPTVGMMIAPDSDNFFLKGLAVEVGLGLGFGEQSLPADMGGEEDNEIPLSDGQTVVAILPRADLVWNVLIKDSRIVPFARFGFGVPIQVAWAGAINDKKVSNYAVSFEIDAGLGVAFNVTERFGLVADARFAFGPSSSVAVTFGTRFK
ncbi:MAG: hypothetical protein K2H73_03090 [Treponemataceae bacterium]|nr:hypothetical protein [Treponemataceae bacterium]